MGKGIHRNIKDHLREFGEYKELSKGIEYPREYKDISGNIREHSRKSSREYTGILQGMQENI